MWVYIVDVDVMTFMMTWHDMTCDMWQVKGGVIDRDQNGEPTGIFRDNAISLIDSVIPEYTRDQMGKALNAAMRSYFYFQLFLPTFYIES